MKVYVSKMGKEELKKKIADIIHNAQWIVGYHGRVEGDFYIENEDEVVEEIIKLVKEK